jgi:hypothetical protein
VDVVHVTALLARASRQRLQAANLPALEFETDVELLGFARAWQGAAGSYQETNCLQAEDGDWRVEATYPTEALVPLMKGGRGTWAAWFRSECVDARADGREGYARLLLEDVEEEVVLVELPDGRTDIWDGWHRAAASIIKGATGMRAVVGKFSLDAVKIPQTAARR